jgi:chromosome segregation ATPase
VLILLASRTASWAPDPGVCTVTPPSVVACSPAVACVSEVWLCFHITHIQQPAEEELESARVELEATKVKLTQVHEHAMLTMRAKSALAEEAEHLKAKLSSLQLSGRDKALSTEAAGTLPPAVESLAAASAEAAQLRQANLQLRAKLEEARAMQQAAGQEAQSRKEEVREQLMQLARKDDELQQKISETKQVKQLMEMLKKKSQEVGLLRRRLIEYEPEDVADADR